MRIKFLAIALFSIISSSIFVSPNSFAASEKSGAPCAKVGNKNSSGSLICSLSSGKKIWKSIPLAKPTASWPVPGFTDQVANNTEGVVWTDDRFSDSSKNLCPKNSGLACAATFRIVSKTDCQYGEAAITFGNVETLASTYIWNVPMKAGIPVTLTAKTTIQNPDYWYFDEVNCKPEPHDSTSDAQQTQVSSQGSSVCLQAIVGVNPSSGTFQAAKAPSCSPVSGETFSFHFCYSSQTLDLVQSPRVTYNGAGNIVSTSGGSVLQSGIRGYLDSSCDPNNARWYIKVTLKKSLLSTTPTLYSFELHPGYPARIYQLYLLA